MREDPAGDKGGDSAAPKRFMAKELYEPVGVLRGLGLPILLWGEQAKWCPNPEAKFMFEIGLLRYPPLETILTLVAAVNVDKRAQALKYFMDNHSTRYTNYQPQAFKHLPFAPAINPDGTSFLTNPTSVYSNEECAVMGFNIVDPSLDKEAIVKLQIASNPPTRMLLTGLLGNPPRDQALSRKYYEYLAGRIADFTPAELERISSTAFIPATKATVSANGATTSTQRMFRPTQVYFGNSQNRGSAPIGLFTFVDFGPKAATFLRAVGVKDEPTTQEIYAIIMQDPKAFKDAVGGYEQYLAELKRVAAQISAFPSVMRKAMSRSPMLVGTRRVAKKSMRSPKERRASDASDDESDMDIHFELLRAEEIMVAASRLHKKHRRQLRSSGYRSGFGSPQTPKPIYTSEVANSLCKVLFATHKINGSLLFMTILSTDLRALKRRGYNVDRILNQQKVERKRAEAARAQLERERKEAQEAESRSPILAPPVVNPQPEGNSRQSVLGTFNNFRQKIGMATGDKGNEPEKKALLNPSESGTRPSSSVHTPRAPSPSSQITSQDHIENSVRMAIAVCRPERKSLLHNRQQMHMVKESLNEGYCDISGATDDFVLTEEVARYRVYIAKDVPNPGLP
ncbi:hypothetical protein FRC08_018378 [Ceratobasidium sp. 394]|nr:hypothetical protein FRC08_018378 [Ceratobasidium sp. 394]